MAMKHLVSERAEIAFTFWLTMFLALLFAAALCSLGFRVQKLEQMQQQNTEAK